MASLRAGSLLRRLDRVADVAAARLAPAGTARTCPFCGSLVDLARCDVVSTRGHSETDGFAGGFEAGVESGDPGAGFDPGFDPGASTFDLGDDPISVEKTDAGEPLKKKGEKDKQAKNVAGWPILIPGTHSDEQEPPRGMLEVFTAAGAKAHPLAPVEELAPTELLPRRACEACGTPFPLEFDQRDARLLAVAGINYAGKTHFLAQALYEGARKGALRRFGCTEFKPTAETAQVFHQHYVMRVQRQRSLLARTQAELAPQQLSMLTTLEGTDPFLLYTHDVSGEAMADPNRRSVDLAFLRRADALIFLLDPLEFDAVRRRVPPELVAEDRPVHQVDLLSQCVAEVRRTRGPHVPICVTVSKSDLLTAHAAVTGAWQHGAATDDWMTDVQHVSADVRQMLSELGEDEVLEALRSAAGAGARVTFHAVSALGAPAEGQRLPDADPIRCADPLGAALYGMTHPRPGDPAR